MNIEINNDEAICTDLKFRHFEVDENVYIFESSLNGYLVGDRLLEDVIFYFTIDKNNLLHVQVGLLHKKYFNYLNKEEWLRLVIEYGIENSDSFQDGVLIPFT